MNTRTYEVRTYGCQMNVHDSERLAGLLDAAGYVPLPKEAAADGAAADIVVLNTCAVRENADNKLYGNLGRLASVKAEKPGMQIAVGGCLAQKDRNEIVRRAPYVDVVFGTHNVGSLPALLERARIEAEAQVEIVEALETFPSNLPSRRESPYAAWVAVSVGCNNTCTFCIVPALRGRERDRRPGDIRAEVEALVAEGVIEVTLLGQNVNAYGVEFGDRFAFGKLLRTVGAVDGLERVRFTSPHPRDFTDDVIAAMAETPAVMPQLHMPLQSGSDRVLRAMRRSYRQDRYLGIVDKVRAAMPHAAITTDIIVGFPGETDEDFEQTLHVVREARFASAFTFQYSKRPGTPAADMPDQVPAGIVRERYQRLAALVEEIAWEESRAFVGRDVEVLVADGEGRKDQATHRLSGRARDNRLVHFSLPGGESAAGPGSGHTPGADREGPSRSGSGNASSGNASSGNASSGNANSGEVPRPGDLVTVGVTYAAPHHLVADSAPAGGTYRVRRTRAGDAHERATSPAGPQPGSRPSGVLLGMPSIGAPRPEIQQAPGTEQAPACRV